MEATSAGSAPPSSPPSQRSSPKRKKQRAKEDPFLSSLPELPPIGLPSPLSPEQEADGSHEDSASESIIRKLILTPLLFSSFLLSLLLINTRNRAWRVSQHRSQTLWTRLSPSFWLDPEPYQDHDDSAWGHRPSLSGATGVGDVPGEKVVHGEAKKKWFTRKKHRKMAKLEFGQALEIRGRVIAAMVVCWLIILGGVVWILRRTVGWYRQL